MIGAIEREKRLLIGEWMGKPKIRSCKTPRGLVKRLRAEPREMVDNTKDLFKKILSAFLERYRFYLPELITEQTPQARQP